MNAETKHSGPVDVIAILRKASRSVPNEDFVAFDDAIFAVVVLVETSSRVIHAFEAYGESKNLVVGKKLRKECEDAMVAQKDALAAFRSAS